eukprot:TRINITY_DN23031_c1_g1_i1.p1 TRINITY_DN23031_c1_g1~~TRINITY_DN23031_c1_g1_i1.p1  ORF type:complete len:943 (+),score=351.63 TRINITY_DN23031_c1_g1_i1:129-2831(+)
MPRSYLRYEPKSTTGVVAANEGNVVVVRNGTGDDEASVVCTPALENVHIFDLKTHAIVGFIPGGNEEGQVSALQSSPTGEHLLIGYSDGHVSLYLTADWSSLMTRGLGHKLTSKVIALALSSDATLLASGASDTDIVMWDVTTQDPVFRLRGHKSAILGLTFLQVNKKLVSVAGDGLIKVWDPEVRACVHTFIGATSLATSICVDMAEARLIIGARDHVLKVYNMEKTDGTEEEMFVPHGQLERANHRPVAGMKYNPAHTLLAVQSTDRVIEFFSVLGEKGVSAKLARQRKRKREKAKDEADVGRSAALEYHRLDSVVLRADSKIRSFAFVPQREGDLRSEPDRLVVALNDNQYEEWHLTWTDSKTEPVTLTKGRTCGSIGHRGEIRSSSMSHSNRLVATCATGSVKVWALELQIAGSEGAIVDCTNTIESEEPTCLTFLPGDNHLIAGTKSGELQLMSLPKSEIMETIPAHDGEVTAVVLRSDKRGVTTAGKDKKLKIWSLDLAQDEDTGGKRVTLVESATLDFTDSITAVTYSPDNKFFAVALQDNTVKVYYADTCKFFLSLYGHKYPVTAISISSDSRLIASGSIDKNVKLWGLDFGDCHKSIFAHDDYVTDVKFVPDTHYLWTAGKDGTVKCWDADHFSHIQTLKGHHGAVWGCELSQEGGVLVSYGADRSVRSWVRSEGLLFPDEEAEREAEEEADKEAAASQAYAALDRADAEVGVAGQRTSLHLKGSEDLVQAIDLASAELERAAEGGAAAEAQHPMLGTRTPLEYLAQVIQAIKGHALRYVLSGLPAEYCKRLLAFCVDLLKDRHCRIESVARVSLFLIRQFSTELEGNSQLRATAISLQQQLTLSLSGLVDTHGFNNAGLAVLQSYIQTKHDASGEFFDLALKKGHKRSRQ